jgi:ferredoxin
MKVNIIPDQCIACGLCHLYAPKVFDYHDNGIVKFGKSDSDLVEKTFEPSDDIVKSAKACPTAAIQIKTDFD